LNIAKIMKKLIRLNLILIYLGLIFLIAGKIKIYAQTYTCQWVEYLPGVGDCVLINSCPSDWTEPHSCASFNSTNCDGEHACEREIPASFDCKTQTGLIGTCKLGGCDENENNYGQSNCSGPAWSCCAPCDPEGTTKICGSLNCCSGLTSVPIQGGDCQCQTPSPTPTGGCLPDGTDCEASDTTDKANCSDCCNGYHLVGGSSFICGGGSASAIGTDPFCSTHSGDGIDTAIGCIPISSGNAFVEWLFPKLLGIMGGIAFLLMLYGGFLVITSSGNQERLKAGHETITSAVAGLVFAIFSLFLLQLIGIDILHIPGLIR
jgi:hypothetical protein